MRLFPTNLLLMAGLTLFSGCSVRDEGNRNDSATGTALSAAPQWAREAIWYQILVERFRNGDPSNDPTRHDLTGSDPQFVPESWSVTPWGHDWYKQEPWHADAKVDNFHYRIQLRRFGGDLQGVLDKLDHIRALGANAIYFNPLNDAPSLHKYDARHYHHIDRNFGPDPRGDEALAASENPGDPSTWRWTAADRLFLKVVEECHRRGIRVIMDYSWNHTGTQFWALKELQEKGKTSPYTDWYNITNWDNPATEANEFQFEGWAGVASLPVFRKDIKDTDGEMPFEGNLHAKSLRDHIFAVSARWLDPDGDGDPGDGVDGFRLDVAGEVPMDFWREYRRFVRSINPEAYLVGEIWWLKWPDSMLDPLPFLQGDQFDAVMNYRWYKAARGFFGQGAPVLNAAAFVKQIDSLNQDIPTDYIQAMMNVTGSHDAPRLVTCLANKGKYKYNAKPSEDPAYVIHRPGESTRREQRLLLLHQFSFPGAPHIWYGDEVGMWGADDPDCRKPMVWDDLSYEPEATHLLPGVKRPVDQVAQDKPLLAYYAQLCAMRRQNPVLSLGQLEFTLADDARMSLAYSRFTEQEEAVAAFNRSDKPQTLEVPVKRGGRYVNALNEEEIFEATGKTLKIELGPVSGVVLIREK